MSNPSISAVITAFNEEKTIVAALRDTESALKNYTHEYEIIVINDGSTDTTKELVDGIASKNPLVRPIHNAKNMNLGYNLRTGIASARKEYTLAFVAADSYPLPASFQNFLNAIGKKDFVISYLPYYGNRTPFRKFLSWLFVSIMNLLFWQRIRYYNGPLIVKTKVWQTVPMTATGFAYMAEVTATLLKRGLSYREVAVELTPEIKGVNLRVLRRNILNVAATLASLFWRLNVARRYYV